MKKVITLTILLFLVISSKSQVTLYDRTWNYTQKIISYIDSSASNLKKEKHNFNRQLVKTKNVSPDNKKIKIKRHVRTRKGNIYVKETYIIRRKCKIKVFKVNGQIHMLSSVITKEDYENRSQNTFTYLGNKKWHWTNRTYNKGNRIYKSEILKDWQ